jgi:hypothetical protein
LVAEPEGKRPRRIWEDIRKDLGNRVKRCELDTSDSGYGRKAGSSEHSNELPGSVNGGEYDLGKGRVLKKN